MHAPNRRSFATGPPARSLAELIAVEADRLRGPLLAAHHGQSSTEDLEDLFAQATLELLDRAERDHTLRRPAHIANALRQKFRSRLIDRHRAIAARSPNAHGRSQTLSLDDLIADVADTHAHGPLHAVLLREQLGELRVAIAALSVDQRLVLTSQIAGQAPREFCAQTGWSKEKYRKCAQRARARLRRELSD